MFDEIQEASVDIKDKVKLPKAYPEDIFHNIIDGFLKKLQVF